MQNVWYANVSFQKGKTQTTYLKLSERKRDLSEARKLPPLSRQKSSEFNFLYAVVSGIFIICFVYSISWFYMEKKVMRKISAK